MEQITKLLFVVKPEAVCLCRFVCMNQPYVLSSFAFFSRLDVDIHVGI